MLIDVVVLAFIWIIVARGGLLFKTTVQTTVSNACISRASVRRASGFLLTAVSNARHIARLTSNFVVKARLRYSTNVTRA